jgi:hypothetical protein
VNRRHVIVGAGAAAAVLAVALPASAYWSGSALTPAATVSAATLQPPGVSTSVVDGDVTLSVTAPASGPAPTSYVVTVKETLVCTLTAPGPCVHAAGRAATVPYSVASRLGDHWKAAATVTAVTPPPAVTLAWAPDTGIPGDGKTSATAPDITVTAPAAVSDYTVDLFAEGAATPFATVAVPAAGTTATRTVTPAFSAGGTLDIVAVPMYSGVAGPQTALAIDVVTGASTLTALAVNPGVTGDRTIGAGDVVRLTFGRPLDPRTVCTTWAATSAAAQSKPVQVTFTDGGAAGITMSLAPAGASQPCVAPVVLGVLTADTNYLIGNKASVTFPGSTLSIDAARTVVTVTLGGTATGDTDKINTIGRRQPIDPASFAVTGSGPFDEVGTALTATTLTAPSTF